MIDPLSLHNYVPSLHSCIKFKHYSTRCLRNESARSANNQYLDPNTRAFFIRKGQIAMFGGRGEEGGGCQRPQGNFNMNIYLLTDSSHEKKSPLWISGSKLNSSVTRFTFTQFETFYYPSSKDLQNFVFTRINFFFLNKRFSYNFLQFFFFLQRSVVPPTVVDITTPGQLWAVLG